MNTRIHTTLRISEEQKQALYELANRAAHIVRKQRQDASQTVSVSKLVRFAIDDFLAKHRPSTCAQRILEEDRGA